MMLRLESFPLLSPPDYTAGGRRSKKEKEEEGPSSYTKYVAHTLIDDRGCVCGGMEKRLPEVADAAVVHAFGKPILMCRPVSIPMCVVCGG